MQFSCVRTMSYLKKHTSAVVKHALETQEPAAITVNGSVQAVIQGHVGYQKTQEQLAMLRILALGRQQIEGGNVIDHDEVVALFELEDK